MICIDYIIDKGAGEGEVKFWDKCIAHKKDVFAAPGLIVDNSLESSCVKQDVVVSSAQLFFLGEN